MGSLNGDDPFKPVSLEVIIIFITKLHHSNNCVIVETLLLPPQPIVLVTLLLCCCKYCIYISSKSSIHKFDLLLKTGSLEILDRLELAGVAVAERGKLNSLIDSRLIL